MQEKAKTPKRLMKRTRKCTFPLEKVGRKCNANNPSLESFDWCEAVSTYESIWVPKLKQKGKGAIGSYRHASTQVSDRSEGRLLSLTAKYILIFFSANTKRGGGDLLEQAFVKCSII